MFRQLGNYYVHWRKEVVSSLCWFICRSTRLLKKLWNDFYETWWVWPWDGSVRFGEWSGIKDQFFRYCLRDWGLECPSGCLSVMTVQLAVSLCEWVCYQFAVSRFLCVLLTDVDVFISSVWHRHGRMDHHRLRTVRQSRLQPQVVVVVVHLLLKPVPDLFLPKQLITFNYRNIIIIASFICRL